MSNYSLNRTNKLQRGGYQFLLLCFSRRTFQQLCSQEKLKYLKILVHNKKNRNPLVPELEGIRKFMAIAMSISPFFSDSRRNQTVNHSATDRPFLVQGFRFSTFNTKPHGLRTCPLLSNLT